MVAVFGHRGARGLLPENTLAGFALAKSLGLTGVEFDIGMTKDNMLVVHHDPRLNPDIARDQNGAYVGLHAALLHELTYQQLMTYDIGRLRAKADYTKRFPRQTPQDGARIPLFDEVLSVCAGLDMLIEVKSFPDQSDDTAVPQILVQAIIQRLRAHHLLDHVILFAFDWRALDEAARLEPGLRRCCLTDHSTIQNARLWFGQADLSDFCPEQAGEVPRIVAATGAKIWAPDFRTLDRHEVERAHDLGLLVIPWTVNEPDEIALMLAIKVDGMISDRPDDVLKIMEQQGITPEFPGFMARHCPL